MATDWAEWAKENLAQRDSFDELRVERDRAVGEAAVLRKALADILNEPVASGDEDDCWQCQARDDIAKESLKDTPLAARAAAVLADTIQRREWELAVQAWLTIPLNQTPFPTEPSRAEESQRIDTYRAALRGEGVSDAGT